ncbi:MAG: hypothetical protein IPG16_02630 [Comamonadaceae bacterium]|nr:hypothetical protein [Comamonadaceae bacterium]
MALSSEESAVLDKLYAVHQATYADDELMLDYYLGQQRVEQAWVGNPAVATTVPRGRQLASGAGRHH